MLFWFVGSRAGVRLLGSGGSVCGVRVLGVWVVGCYPSFSLVCTTACCRGVSVHSLFRVVVCRLCRGWGISTSVWPKVLTLTSWVSVLGWWWCVQVVRSLGVFGLGCDSLSRAFRLVRSTPRFRVLTGGIIRVVLVTRVAWGLAQ